MVQFPNDSFPGPLRRVQLMATYPATKLNSDATPDDIVARKINSENVEEEAEVEATTLADEDVHERKKRSFLNKIIFTRVGVYRMIESRLNA